MYCNVNGIIVIIMKYKCFRVKSMFLIEFLKPTHCKNQYMLLQQSPLLKVSV